MFIFQKKYFVALASIFLICCMFLFYIVFLYKDKKVDLLCLPLLPVEKNEEETESYFAYDISELYDGNPWKEEWNIETLPVFYNTELKNRTQKDKEAKSRIQYKREFLEQVAKKFGVTKKDSIIYDTWDIFLESKAYSFQMNLYQDVLCIKLKEPITLPFSYEPERKEQAEKAISYFMDTYKDYFDWKEAEKALSCWYDVYGKKYFSLYAYENGDTLEEKLLQYHFNRAYFKMGEKNELKAIFFRKTDLSEKIGEYPIITTEQAKQLLYSQKYSSVSGNTFLQNMTLVKTELVYKDSIYDSIFMPCYKFFVQLPEEKENGLRHYDVYYIPAIQEQYLKFD